MEETEEKDSKASKEVLEDRKRIVKLIKSRKDDLIRQRKGMQSRRSGYTISQTQFLVFAETICHYIKNPDYVAVHPRTKDYKPSPAKDFTISKAKDKVEGVAY